MESSAGFICVECAVPKSTGEGLVYCREKSERPRPDQSRGAEFEGTGRREDGITYEVFRVAACDNGAAGSGQDFFRISTVAGYFNEGFLASGDIVKTRT
jgi:hypothetical protein